MLLALLTFLAIDGGLGVPVLDHDAAVGFNVAAIGVGGSAAVEEMDTPPGDGVAFVDCRRAAHDPGGGVVRGGVAYVGPWVHPGRAVAVGGVALASGSRRCGGRYDGGVRDLVVLLTFWAVIGVVVGRLLLSAVVPTGCHESSTGFGGGGGLCGVLNGVAVAVSGGTGAAAGFPAGDGDGRFDHSSMLGGSVDGCASMLFDGEGAVVATTGSTAVSPLTLGAGERSGREEEIDAVSAASFFFFFLLRGGRFFFSGSASGSKSASHLLDATSESETPSSSAVDFQ